MERSEGQANLFQLWAASTTRLARVHQTHGALLVLYSGLYDRLWATIMQSHPIQDPETGLEHIWAFIRTRFGYEQANMMQEHFDTHVREDGKDAAYQCLVRNCLGAMESLHMSRSIHSFPAKWLLKFAVEGNEGD